MTPELRALAEQALASQDAPLSWTCLKDRPGGNAVWRAAGPDGSAIVKRHAHPRGYSQELRAYRDWLPQLAAAASPDSLVPSHRARGASTPTPGAAVLNDSPVAGHHPGGTSTPNLLAPREAASPVADHRARGASTPGSLARDVAVAMSPGPPVAGPRAGGVSTPSLLAHDDRLRALVLTWGTGEAGDPSPERPAGSESMHEQAGRFARALHDLPVPDDDAVPLAPAISRRLKEWNERARAALTPAERAGLAALARGVDAFAGVRRTPCHRDFTPDNWLSFQTCLYVVDFEHARLDAPEVDLVKLRAEVWPTRPDLRAAFLRGHGPQDGDAVARLDVLLALHATATLAWAHRHRDPVFRARGEQALRAALASLG